MCVNLYEKQYVCVCVTAYVQQHFSADVQKQLFYVMIGTLGGMVRNWTDADIIKLTACNTTTVPICIHICSTYSSLSLSLSIYLSEYVSALIIYVQTCACM